uniref:Apurinic/apyrimidinic endodeoxyribonuclease 1 n=2 Tax=Lemuriformes TaxID=376915 RepID=A0A2K6FZ22_PROCO
MPKRGKKGAPFVSS